MKLKGFLHCLILTLTVGVATFTNATFNEEKDIIATEAANISAGTKLYLKPNSNWKDANARFAAYFCNGTASAKWANMSDPNGDGIYEVAVPTGTGYHANVIFCRMNPSASANSWSNKWDQTNNLVFDGTKNLYTVSDGAWSYGSGTWSQYKFPINTKMYVDFNGNWNGDGAVLSVYNFINDSENEWLDVTQVDGSSIYEFTVSLDQSIIILVRSNPSNPDHWNGKWNESNHIYPSATSGANYFKATGFSSDGMLTFEFDSTLTYSNVETWAQGLVGEGKCDPDGVKKNYDWSSLKAGFEALTAPEQHLLVTATADKTSDSDVQHALATYDYLVDVKKESPFIKEGTIYRSSNSMSFFNARNNNQAIMIFVVVTIVTVSIVGVMVYKKRKSISE